MKRQMNAADSLAPDAIAEFHRRGYIALNGVLAADEVDAARQALTSLVRTYSQNRSSGVSIQFEPGFDPDESINDIHRLELSVRKFMRFVDLQPALKRLVEPDHRIVKIVSQILGPDPILFQDMALVKPAHIGSEKPWHQDNAYFSVAPLDSVAGVWIALDDATVDNGCMHVIPGWHMRGAFVHHHDRDCEIAPERLPIADAVPVPIEAGGAMFFYGMLPHQTPPNASPQRRRALQFHFRAASSQIVADGEYDALYADRSGAPASCAAARMRGL